MKKIYSISVIVMCTVAPAFADPTNTSDSFPLNELMQPDYRYLNSAIYPNTGVYDGDVTANAMYDWDLFSPTAGNYLPANSTTITQCTAGSFCAGATNIHYDSIDQGITSCSTLGDNSYTQSATGSSLETDCYRNCSGNVTIEHATTITGNDYYGNGTDTCAATACEGGYHTDNNACGANVLTITWANSENPNTTCTYGGSITTPATAPTIPGKTFVGWAMGYDFSTLPTNENYSVGYGKHRVYECRFFEYRGSEYSYGTYQTCDNTVYNDLNIDEWKAVYSFGTVYGTSLCSSTRGTSMGDVGGPKIVNNDRSCWCKVTGFRSPNGTFRYKSTQTLPWVYRVTHDTVEKCQSGCASRCAYMLGGSDGVAGVRNNAFGVTQ